MNSINLSQRLNARMHFKSLLLLSLFAGSASAQSPMPAIPFELPNTAPVPAIASDRSELQLQRSTWTLRQHTNWLLGLKARHSVRSDVDNNVDNVVGVTLVNSLINPALDTVEPSVPEVPHIDTVITAAELAKQGAAETPTQLSAGELPEVPSNAILLVQHTEPVPQLVGPSVSEEGTPSTAGNASEEAQPVTPADQASSHSLNLRPVVSGPAPALPLDQFSGDSLLEVDVSGVDVSKLITPAQPGESLIDELGFRPPTGFSMRDSDTGSVAASPSRAKPVSIHEGFTPRVTSANQPAQLNGTGKPDQPTDRLRVSVPGPSQFSLSDKNDTASGPILNRLSDKQVVHEQLKDDDNQPSIAKAGKAVEKSFSDKGSLLTSLPVEVNGENDKTSRSGKPVELTPPARLAQEPPRALPLTTVMPIASTGIDANLPSKNALPTEPETIGKEKALPTPQAPTPQALAKTEPVSDKAQEKTGISLIEGFIPPTLLSAADSPKPSKDTSSAPAPLARVFDKPTQAKVVTANAATFPNNAPTNAIVAAKVDATKADQPQAADRVTLSDFNPLALKRPVIRAANVAIPQSAKTESAVVPTSHEVGETDEQASEYAKLAAQLQQAVKQKFPNIRVKVSSNEDGLVVDGNVANNVEASKVLSFVRKTSLCPVADRLTTSQ